MSKKEIVLELFDEGFNCAASILAGFCEDYDLDTEIALKLACGLGGGFGRGGICGALSAAVLVVGLKYGQYIPGDLGTKANCGAKRTQLIDMFAERHGSPACRDLLAQIPDTSGEDYPKRRHNFCSGLLEGTVDLLEELGY